MVLPARPFASYPPRFHSIWNSDRSGDILGAEHVVQRFLRGIHRCRPVCLTRRMLGWKRIPDLWSRESSGPERVHHGPSTQAAGLCLQLTTVLRQWHAGGLRARMVRDLLPAVLRNRMVRHQPPPGSGGRVGGIPWMGLRHGSIARLADL